MNHYYPEYAAALVTSDLESYACKFNKAIIRDYDDLNYFEALYFSLSDGTAFELQCYDGTDKSQFNIYIPPALTDPAAFVQIIIDLLGIDKQAVTIYLDNYEKHYSVATWNSLLEKYKNR